MGRSLCVVSFGKSDDHGLLVQEGDKLVALWPDGGADTVERDRRGWFWDEYGDTTYPAKRHRHATGTQLLVVSRRAGDVRDMQKRVAR